MKLSEAIADELAKSTHGPQCTVALVLAELDDDDRATLLDLLDSRVPYTHIERATTAIGHRVPSGAASRHRRGLCGCSR